MSSGQSFDCPHFLLLFTHPAYFSIVTAAAAGAIADLPNTNLTGEMQPKTLIQNCKIS
jgi:hypothetical protein